MKKESFQLQALLSARVSVAGLIVAAEIMMLYEKARLIAYAGHAAFWLTMAAGAGALGALSSAIARAGKVTFAMKAMTFAHSISAILTALLGMLCGLAIVTDIHIEEILQPLARNMRPFVALAIAASASALIESLAAWMLGTAASVSK